MRRLKIAGMLVAATAVAALLSAGCNGTSAVAPMKPTLKPPAIGKAGILRAAIDLSYPPFAGTDKGKQAGLDIDVASAVAERLGLKLQIVDARMDDAAAMLRDGKVDVALAGIRIDQAVQADVAFAGPYISDAPAIFATTESTQTMRSIAGSRIAGQQGSPAYWLLADEYGDDTVATFPTLVEAFAATEAGQADYAVGDGVVGLYMLRQHPKLRLVGQLTPAMPVGVAVGKQSLELERAVRDALDKLSSSGVLETLRRKWLGDAPRFAGSSDASASAETTVAP